MVGFAKRIQDNLDQMGTQASEWVPVEITGMQETEDGEKPAAMPTFAFPKGYDQAPSLFSGKGACCELCGKDIKNYFWIQNDSKRLVMPVGSECVTMFGQGLSGERIAKEAAWAANREALVSFLDARRDLFKAFTFTAHTGYGRTQKCFVETRAGIAARALWQSMKDVSGSMERDSADASVSRWVSKNKAQADGMIANAAGMILDREAYLAKRNANSIKNGILTR